MHSSSSEISRTSVESPQIVTRYKQIARRPQLALSGERGEARSSDNGPTLRRVSEEELVEQLRQKDEKAFAGLVERYHMPMVRLAMTFVPSRSVAEEVVQDTWLGVIKGIDGFEERSSLKTWMYSILINRARKTGARERRIVAVDDADTAGIEQFSSDGSWSRPPVEWTDDVIDRLFATAMAQKLRTAIDGLPPAQCQVVTLRDVERLSAREVCDVLGVSEANQRVLLHRARSQLRRTIDLESEGR
jgi:RNA polymerase sigma-70 factor, ECF subfamily